jgi:DNA-binding transcriptional LysR family regulator
MDRIQAMAVFVAVAEEEGFAPAARRLAMSPPVVTRAIAALEQRIGAKLLHRTTRNVRLTEAGTRYLEDCRRILSEIDEAEEAAAGSHREPQGQLSITASVLFGRLYVAPILLNFLSFYPRVSARTLFVDRIVNLMDEGVDVAVRIAHLPDSGMTARKVGSVRRLVCASPDYLTEYGIPQEPTDLVSHRIIAFQGITPSPEWSFQNGYSEAKVRLSPRLEVNTAEMAITAAVQGHGLTRVLSYMVAPELVSGQLKIVLAEYEPAPIPIQLVHREGRQASARVRAFVDFAAKLLRSDGSIN